MSIVSLHGRRLGLAQTGNFVGNGMQLSSPLADAVITVSAEAAVAANRREIGIQLLDVNGNELTEVVQLMAVVYLNAAATSFVVTGGSTGIAIGTDGALLALVAKKVFLLTCEADGDIDLTWTDTGDEAAYLGLWMPSGRIVMSSALTNAA